VVVGVAAGAGACEVGAVAGIVMGAAAKATLGELDPVVVLLAFEAALTDFFFSLSWFPVKRKVAGTA